MRTISGIRLVVPKCKVATRSGGTTAEVSEPLGGRVVSATKCTAIAKGDSYGSTAELVAEFRPRACVCRVSVSDVSESLQVMWTDLQR